jgi:hypothetical protein
MTEQEFDPLDEEPFEESSRDENGRFRKGCSGNPRGRRMQFRSDPKLPASRRRVISDVADRKIEVKIDGQAREMSLFEANVHALAVAGAKGNRVAAQKFIDLMLGLADKDLERRLVTQSVRQHYDRLEKENERLRQTSGQRTGTVHIPVDSLNDWDPHRRLDDEEGVDQALSGFGGPEEERD